MADPVRVELLDDSHEPSNPVRITNLTALANALIALIQPTAALGDVIGPIGSVNHNFARFNGVTGKAIEDSGVGQADFAPVAKGVTGGDSHDHDGGDGAQLDHTKFSNIGTNTHAQIDTKLAAQSDHLNLSNIGVRTHAEIDATLDLIDLDTFDVPHGSFSSNVNQAVAAPGNAVAITYSDTEDTHHVTLSNSSRINIAEAGVYFISFSAVGISVNNGKKLEIWMAINGVSLVRSNTITKFTGANSERVVTVTYIVPFTAGQYFELKMCGDDAQVSLQATAIQLSPTRPACPSIIVTVNKISDT